MAYSITTTSGASLGTILDGTVNSTATSLTLIGKNYAGYGNFLNENFVYLLENFSNTTAPTNALTGQLWYDSSSSVLKVYSGSQWKPISSSASGTSTPTSPVTGDLWWDTANAVLKVYNGTGWTTIGPSYTTTTGTSGPIVETILDSSSNSHVVVKFYINDTIMAILSKDPTFVPQTSITGFNTIVPGFNLASASAVSGSQFTGDVSNALTLQGVNAGQFLRSDQNTSTDYKITAGGGVTIGSDLNINSAPSSNEVRMISTTNNRNFNIYVTNNGNIQSVPSIGINGQTGGVTFANLVTVSGNIMPAVHNTVSLGNSTVKFSGIYATTLTGAAITAQYADLAERFASDAVYLPGTVVELGGLKEITSAVEELSEKVFGVISTAAGFLMNGAAGDDQTHPPVAVNGRVPVRVIGQVRKGDRLVSAGNGIARAAQRTELTPFNVLGRSLENKTTSDEGVIEAIVKLNS